MKIVRFWHRENAQWEHGRLADPDSVKDFRNPNCDYVTIKTALGPEVVTVMKDDYKLLKEVNHGTNT